jgi:hypothetical protein
MDDLAPAPTLRTSDNGGRTREEKFAGRKKAVKWVEPARAQNPEPEPEPAAEPLSDHRLDILA